MYSVSVCPLGYCGRWRKNFNVVVNLIAHGGFSMIFKQIWLPSYIIFMPWYSWDNCDKAGSRFLWNNLITIPETVLSWNLSVGHGKIFLSEFLSLGTRQHEKCELKPQKNDKSRYECHLNKPADVIYENFGLKRERIIEVKSLSGEIIGSR